MFLPELLWPWAVLAVVCAGIGTAIVVDRRRRATAAAAAYAALAPEDDDLCTDCRKRPYGEDGRRVPLAVCSVCLTARCSPCHSLHQAPDGWPAPKTNPLVTVYRDVAARVARLRTRKEFSA